MARISTGRITLFSLLLALVLFTGAFAWYAFAGDQNDDYVYLHEFTNEKHFGLCDDFDLCMGDPVSTVSQVISSSWKHYIYWDNGRLGSVIMFATNLLPWWLTDGLNAFMLAAMFLLAMRLALGQHWGERPLMCMALCVLMWWVLPWHEFLLATSFAINYIWGAVLCMWLLLLLFTGKGKLWAVCILAFVAGTMHEGTSMMMDVMLCLYCLQLLRREGWVRRFMLPCIVFALASLLVIFSPSVWVRSGEGSMFHFTLWLPSLINLFLIRQYFFTLMLCVTAVAGIWMRRDRFLSFLRDVWPLYAATFVGLLLIDYVLPSHMERSMWLCNVLLIIEAVKLAGRWHMPVSAALRRLMAFVLLTGMGVWMGAVACVQYGLRQEFDVISRLYVSSGCPMVYARSTVREHLPWWTLGIPMTVHDSILSLSFHLHSKYMSHDLSEEQKIKQRKNSQLIILDPSDSLVRMDSLPLLPGNMRARRSGNTFYIDSLHGMKATYTLSKPDRADATRIPWLEFRLWNKPESGFSHNVHLYLKKVPVTEKMRRRGIVPPGRDTLYFFEVENFSYPRMLYGMHVERIDSIYRPPKTSPLLWINQAVSSSLTPMR